MATLATICRSTISYLNEHLEDPGKSYIFINGVNNNIDEAEEAASSISRWLNSKRVVLFYNPTRLEDHRITAVQTNLLVNGLLYLIQNEVRKCRDTLQEGREIKIYIFSHSHGSVLTKNAMQRLESIRDKIVIISFGGGVLIPNSIASKVHNFINEFDLVPLLANSIVPNDSDASRLIEWLGSDGRIQQIFSEILLYQQSGDENAAQAVKSALVGHHQIKCFEKIISSFESARDENEAISRGVQSGVVLFEGIFHQLISALNGNYSVSIQKLPNHPIIDSEKSSMLAKIIRNPYTGEAILSAIDLMFNTRTIDFFEAHALNTYLQSVRHETILS